MHTFPDSYKLSLRTKPPQKKTTHMKTSNSSKNILGRPFKHLLFSAKEWIFVPTSSPPKKKLGTWKNPPKKKNYVTLNFKNKVMLEGSSILNTPTSQSRTCRPILGHSVPRSCRTWQGWRDETPLIGKVTFTWLYSLSTVFDGRILLIYQPFLISLSTMFS